MASPRAIGWTLAIAISAFGGAARAATISGQVQTPGGTGIGSSAVSLFAPGPKGWQLQTFQTSDGSGNYTFSGLAAGSYRIFAAPPSAAFRAAAWYDALAPSSSGRLADHADDLGLVTAGSTLTGINPLSAPAGGVSGRVRTSGGTTLAGHLVRVQERQSGFDARDVATQGGASSGVFTHSGLPADSYLFIVYDPNATYQTLVFPGPYTITANSNLALGDFVAQPLALDPNEPNNNAGAPTSTIDASGLHDSPPTPFVSTNAAIAPRGSDVDWYCFAVVAGDHLLLRAIASVSLPTGTAEHPWIDPLLRFWVDGGTALSVTADDDGASKQPRIEVWIEQDGVGCATVTTYGDVTWVGTGQGSAGAYTMRIEQLNRRPVMSDLAPQEVNEGEVAVVPFSYADPDLDALNFTAVLTDALGAVVPDGDLDVGVTDGTFTWNVSQIAAAASPYTLTITASDGVYDDVAETTIDVVAVNVAPPVPVLLSPIDGEEVVTATPTLLISALADDDGEVYDVELELRYGSADAPLAQTTSVPSSAPTWIPAALPEDTTVHWRARASDGEAQSPWSATHVFLVNTTVEPSAPDAPDPVDEEPAAPPTPRDQGCNAAGSDAVALLLGYAMLRAALVREQHRRRQAPVGGVA